VDTGIGESHPTFFFLGFLWLNPPHHKKSEAVCPAECQGWVQPPNIICIYRTTTSLTQRQISLINLNGSVIPSYCPLIADREVVLG
jgi:hypothetical protein